MTSALDEIADLLRRGEVVGAYDRARGCLAAGEDHPRLRYLSVLALARSGATGRAAAQYRALGLHRQRDVDSASLWARILKDAAFAAPPGPRPRLLARAARAYAAVHARTGSYFPGINAATLTALSGRREAAATAAAALLRDPALAAPADYWSAASRAEALVILGRLEEAAAAFSAARVMAGRDYGAVSSTRRQLETLTAALVPDPAAARDLLGRLALPRVAHHDAPELDEADEPALAARIAAALAREEVGFGIGPFWTTGALVAAEALLRHGAELHLVLPFPAADYLAIMAATRPDELARRGRCIEAAATLTSATSDGDFPDPRLVGYAAEIAAGLALTRARRLSTECVELDLGMSGRPARRREAPALPGAMTPGGPVREVRALLFADVLHFSSIPESSLPGFWSGFMSEIAAVLDAAGPAILYRNTWGDALFVVVDEIRAAAELALAIQARAAALRLHDPATPELRIGLHHGPVFRGRDAVRGVEAYFGTQVSRAARVEPVAPPGAVFVTEPFAAILAATGDRRFEAEYVGVVPLPKKYGEHRLYRLARRWTDAPAIRA